MLIIVLYVPIHILYRNDTIILWQFNAALSWQWFGVERGMIVPRAVRKCLKYLFIF